MYMVPELIAGEMRDAGHLSEVESGLKRLTSPNRGGLAMLRAGRD